MNKLNIGNLLVGVVVFLGISLLIVGLSVEIPGGALTTYESLDGATTDGYTFDDKYSAIDEYVGGDAYNYIIGASLVAGQISGAMISKAVYIVGGIICISIGFVAKALQQKKEKTIIEDIEESLPIL